MSFFNRIGNAVSSVIRRPNLGGADVRVPTTTARPAPVPPPRRDPINADVELIRDFADVILKLDDTAEYASKAARCAEFVRRSIKTGEPAPPPQSGETRRWVDRWSRTGASGRTFGLRTAYTPTFFETSSISILRPQITDIQDISAANRGSRAREKVFSFMDEVLAFSSQARNAGFDPPDNPFVEIGRLNSLRTSESPRISVTVKEANDLLYNIQVYVNLIDAASQGAINLEVGVFNAAQLEHVTLSYSGLGGTGNNAADLMRLLPSSDEIKAKKARDALSVLNFGKRLPSIIFVAEYNPNQDEGAKGALIGWKRMPDAAGYIVKRHSIIGNEDTEFEVTNDDLLKNQVYAEYVRAYILTFYDKIHLENACLFLDTNPPAHDFCIYRIQAYQNKKESAASIIPSGEGLFVPMNLSGAKKLAIQSRLRELDPGDIDQLGEETISPWPVIAEQVLGDASLDWILAAANIRNSIDINKEEKTTTRKYSYLNAHLKFLLQQADIGRLIQPRSMVDVRDAVNNAIQTYGVTQTIESLLQDTGILYYFDGRDSREDTVFDRAGTEEVQTSSVVGAVAAAIDAESATINLESLATNLASILSDGKLEDYTTTLEMAAKKAEGVKPAEIDIDPDLFNDTRAESGIQFIAQLGEGSDSTVDLTTFDGVAKMMRVIRVMSDFGPNRIPPKIPAPPPAPPTPVVTPPAQNLPVTRPSLPDSDDARRNRRFAIGDRIDRITERNIHER